MFTLTCLSGPPRVACFQDSSSDIRFCPFPTLQFSAGIAASGWTVNDSYFTFVPAIINQTPVTKPTFLETELGVAVIIGVTLTDFYCYVTWHLHSIF